MIPASSAAPARGPLAPLPTDDRNPADFAPAVPSGGGLVTLQHDLQSLPSSNDVAGLPPLHLDLHVYSPSVPERYALINMHRVREGDTLPEGPRVIQITHEGVVLDYRGQEFILGQQP
jgi:general secretion pathway protein B